MLSFYKQDQKPHIRYEDVEYNFSKYNSKKLIWYTLIFWAVVSIVAIILFANLHKAHAYTEKIDQQFSSSGTNFSAYADYTMTQIFHPSKYNITRVFITCAENPWLGGATTTSLALYEGFPGTGTLVATSSAQIDCNGTGGGSGYFDFNQVVQINPDFTHSFVITRPNQFYAQGIIDSGFDGYLLNYPENANSVFRTYYSVEDDEEVQVEIIELPDWDGTVQVGSEDELYYMEDVKCIVGENCYWEYRYNYALIDYDIFLVPTDADYNTPDYAIASSTLRDKSLLMGYFDLTDTDPGEPGGIDFYNLLVRNPTETETRSFPNLSITWIMPDPNFYGLFDDMDCATICDDIGTTTPDNFFEGVLYGFQCAGRKIACWAFLPSEQSVIKFSRAYYSMSTSFPFSVYNQIKREFIDLTNASSSAEVYYLDPVFGDRMSGTDAPILYTGIISEKIGSSLYDKIQNIMTYFIYLSVLAYFIIRIVHQAKKGQSGKEQE